MDRRSAAIHSAAAEECEQGRSGQSRTGPGSDRGSWLSERAASSTAAKTSRDGEMVAPVPGMECGICRTHGHGHVVSVLWSARLSGGGGKRRSGRSDLRVLRSTGAQDQASACGHSAQTRGWNAARVIRHRIRHVCASLPFISPRRISSDRATSRRGRLRRVSKPSGRARQ
jgi:hypothetical protein